MNITEKINELINKEKLFLHDFFIFTDDGRQIFINEKNDVSLGVLVAGIWQAAQELHNRLGFKNEEKLQLNFCDSSTGIYIISIESAGNKYLMGCFYENELNPGKLKNIIKNQIHDVEKIINIKVEHNRKNDEYLFKNISDIEINKMFSSIGI